MNNLKPDYLLYCTVTHDAESPTWRFILRDDGRRPLDVAGTEPNVLGERLELLSVVRGLESLDQPSRVNLITPSRNVRRGIRYGLDEWRENQWRWERFGVLVPVKNCDLWQRLDRAITIHRVKCRTWRIDPAHLTNPAPAKIKLRDRLTTALDEYANLPRPAFAG
jgi:ribonuclease HI